MPHPPDASSIETMPTKSIGETVVIFGRLPNNEPTTGSSGNGSVITTTGSGSSDDVIGRTVVVSGNHGNVGTSEEAPATGSGVLVSRSAGEKWAEPIKEAKSDKEAESIEEGKSEKEVELIEEGKSSKGAETAKMEVKAESVAKAEESTEKKAELSEEEDVTPTNEEIKCEKYEERVFTNVDSLEVNKECDIVSNYNSHKGIIKYSIV